MMKLNHLATAEVARNDVFRNLSSYDKFCFAIEKYGLKFGKKDSKEYADRTGSAYEVYTEFFFKRYGTSANPHLGVKCIEDTSKNKFQAGYDFTYETFGEEPALLQSKYRTNPQYKFTLKDLSTFMSLSDGLDIPKKNRILFTNVENTTKDNGIFHHSYQFAQRQMRVIARQEQESFIDRDPTFWQELEETVTKALIPRDDFKDIYVSREHQVRMEASFDNILNNGGRGKVICATGGGKTLVMFKGIRKSFLEKEFRIQVMVAPTIDLIRQHHFYFEQFGLFHKDKIAVTHFRTGEEARNDDQADYNQTTRVEDLDLDKQQLIYVTYASEENLFSGLKKLGIKVDCIWWDEFHHTVKQSEEYKRHLLSVPSSRNIFFSASEKRGKIISSFDEEVYGPTLINVTYAELRAKALLVPKIIVKPIIINASSSKIKGLEEEFKKSALRKKFDLKEAVLEAAGTIVARNDMINTYGKCVGVTFSKAVPICKEIASNKVIREYFQDLETVHAGVPNRDRKKIYDKIDVSQDFILCQYSIVKEGIDKNGFNCAVISRNMDVSGTQQGLGRTVRADPRDTTNFEKGLISLDSPEGWYKYYAVVYVIVTSTDMEDFNNFLKDIVDKLEKAGFCENDWDMQGITEERHGPELDEDGWVVPIDERSDIIQAISLVDAISKARIEWAEEAEKAELDEKLFRKMEAIKKLSIEEKIKELCDDVQNLDFCYN